MSQKRHVHAELMALYAQDAMGTDRPWERWEIASMDSGEWSGCTHSLNWNPRLLYRRKPKTSRERFEEWAYKQDADHMKSSWAAWQEAERQAANTANEHRKTCGDTAGG